MSTWWIINAVLIVVGLCTAIYTYTHQTSEDYDALLWFVFGVALVVIGLLSSSVKLLS